MPRSAQTTRQRLLDAASEEFAAYGVAGARVDRIAAQAGCNKALIYSYFGSKDALFDAVFDAMVSSIVADVPITPDDLPAYAGRLFDRHITHPEVIRLALWSHLEGRQRESVTSGAAQADAAKAAAIRRAQQQGHVSDRFSARDLLRLVLTISALPLTTAIEEGALPASRAELQRRRRLVVDAVRLLVSP